MDLRDIAFATDRVLDPRHLVAPRHWILQRSYICNSSCFRDPIRRYVWCNMRNIHAAPFSRARLVTLSYTRIRPRPIVNSSIIFWFGLLRILVRATGFISLHQGPFGMARSASSQFIVTHLGREVWISVLERKTHLWCRMLNATLRYQFSS